MAATSLTCLLTATTNRRTPDAGHGYHNPSVLPFPNTRARPCGNPGGGTLNVYRVWRGPGATIHFHTKK